MSIAGVAENATDAGASAKIDEALLVYNPNAGGSAEDQSLEFQRALEQAGFRPVYRATKDERDLDEILPEANGLVVVVGGDGSLRAAVKRMLHHNLSNPIAIVPNGTANNVGHTLGLSGDALDIIKGLERPRRRLFDVGRLITPGETHYFLEGGGFGLYAECLVRYQPEQGKSIWRGLSTLHEVLSDLAGISTRLRLDGTEEEGDYIVLEALNTKAVGPRLHLADAADPGDGLLEVARIKADQREPVLTYTLALAQGDTERLESVALSRVKKLEFQWSGFPLHFDAEYLGRPKEASEDHDWCSIDLLPQRLEFWLPGEGAEHEE